MEVPSKHRILFITQGNLDHASSRIRCIQYFPMLNDAGFGCWWLPRVPRRKKQVLYRWFIFPLLKRINLLRIASGVLFYPYDILFVQRMFLPAVLIRMVRKRGKKMIFDFDDAIYISPRDPKAGNKTVQMVEPADRVIVSAPVLLKFASAFNANVSLITSPVRVGEFRQPEGKPGITIGWIGSEWTSGYLLSLSHVFIRLREEYPVHFLFVGCRPGILPETIPEIIPWSLEREEEMLSRMDIGIMPLDDGEFERGKGGYKLLQYMAVGLPVVASPVGINKMIVQEGVNGFLCSNPEEWYNALERLIHDEPFRRSAGEAGYRLVSEKYSLEVCFAQLRSIMDKLI